MMVALDSMTGVADQLLNRSERYLDQEYLSSVLALEVERIRGLVKRGGMEPPRGGDGSRPLTVVGELLHAIEVLGGRRAGEAGPVFRTHFVAPMPWAFRLPFREIFDLCCTAVEGAMRADRCGIVTFSLDYVVAEERLHIIVADSRRIRRTARRMKVVAPSSPDLMSVAKRLGGEVRCEQGELRGFIQSIAVPAAPLDAVVVTANDIGRLPKLVSSERQRRRRALIRHGLKERLPDVGWALVIEPNGIVRMNLERLLRSRGYNTAAFADGRLVPQFVQGNRVALLLIDVEDRGVLTAEWWNELIKGGFQGATIGLAAHRHDIPGGLRQRFAHVVSKPIERDALEAALELADPIMSLRQPERRRGSIGAGGSAVEGDLESLVREYAVRLPGVVHGIGHAVSRGELAAVRTELHRLKAAALFGYPEVSALARSLERDLAEARSAEFQAHLRALNQLVGQLGRPPSAG